MNRDTPEPTHPFPPRFRWLKRGLVLLVLWVGFISGLRAWWGHEADVRYRLLVSSAHAAGQPILPEDFDSPPAPASENAALSLVQAAESIVTSRSYDTLTGDYSGRPLSDFDLQTLKTTLASNTIALRLAREAQSQLKVDWGCKVRTPVAASLHSSELLERQRDLLRLLRFAALYDHVLGNDKEAVELVQEMLRQANAVTQAPLAPTSSTTLVFYGYAATTVEKIAANLAVDSEKGSRSTPSAARGSVESLIQSLLDDRAVQSTTQRALYVERLWDLDRLANGTSPALPAPVLLKPLYRLDAIRLGDQIGHLVTGTTVPNWTAVRALHQKLAADERSTLEDAATFFSTDRSSAIELHLLWAFRVMTERRYAAIGLAIRLYRLDHDDRYPRRLTDLVPGYLPAVPSDRMATDNRPMGYRLVANLPVIFSVEFQTASLEPVARAVPVLPQVPMPPRLPQTHDDQRDVDH